MSLRAMTCAMAMRDVTASEKLLLLALANYADEHMRAFPSQSRLAADTCLSARTIRSLLFGLEERLIISRIERQRPDGSRATDIITLHFAGEIALPPDGGAATISGGGEVVSGGVRKPLPGGGEVVSPLTTFEPVIEPNEASEEASRPKRARSPFPKSSRVPDGWAPTAADLEVGAAEGFAPGEIERELAKFRDHEFRTPRSDWSAAFRNWLRQNPPSPNLRLIHGQQPNHNSSGSAAHGRKSGQQLAVESLARAAYSRERGSGGAGVGD